MELPKSPYPHHLSDPLRREIAGRYIQHELRKLFPSLQDDVSWKLIDADVEKWFSENILLTPVRGFWNGFYAIARGFRFKNLLPLLTSKNIHWEEKSMTVESLQFGATFEGLDFLGPNPQALKVKDVLRLPEHKEKKEKLLEALMQKGIIGSPRDEDKVIVHVINGALRVIDGNRRVFEALFTEKKYIPAFIGTPIAVPEFFEQWVPAGFLQDLLELHAQNVSAQPELTNVIARTVAATIKDSTSGKAEWRAICNMSNEPLDKLLYQATIFLLQS
jgi:hypothetical protein